MEAFFECRDVVASDVQTVTMHRFVDAADCNEERAAYMRWVAGRIITQAYLGRLAVVDGKVISGAGLVLLDWGPTRGNVGGICARVVAVFTEPALRRRGLASRLVREVVERGRELGVRDFRLAASSEGAGLYRELGFRSYGAEMILKG
jgi:GNAT superfamily N-acetyltransferase